MSNISLLKRLAFILCLVAVVALPSVASAELNELAPKKPSKEEVLKKKQKPYEIRFGQCIALTNLGMLLMRSPELQDGQFVLRMLVNEKTINGCIHPKDFETETKYSGRSFDIDIKSIALDPESLKSKAPHYECAATMQNPKLDVVLNVADLKKNGTKYIRIKSGFITDYYDLQITDNKVELLHSDTMSPMQYYKPYKNQLVADPLTLWFYPKGTLILSVPDADPADKTIKSKIEQFAAARGMKPLNAMIMEFESPLVKTTDYYYVDTAGTVQVENNPVIGSISMQATRFGLQEDENAADVGLSVYARTPRVYE
jgi:hypothetical protein